MPRINIFIVAVCLWACSGLLRAQVVFNTETTSVSLNGAMQFLPDDDKRLALDGVIQAQREGRMKNLPGPLSRGYAPVTSWLSVVVHNDGTTPAAPTLLLEPPYLDEVDVYVKNGAEPGQPQDYQRYSVGDHTPVAEQPMPSALMTVPLSIEPRSSQRIFIRVHSFSSHNISAKLLSPKQLVEITSRHQIWQSSYVAIAMAMAIINFLLALRLRDKVNAMYGLYLLSIAIATIGIEGLVRQVLPQTAHLLADWLVGAGIGLTFISVTLFIMFLFKTAQHHRWVYRYQLVFIVLAAAMALAIGTPWYLPLAQIVQLNGIFLAFLAPWLAWRSIKRGEVATGRMFLIAFGANSLGVLITISGVLGILPLQEYTRHAVQFTSVIHMLLTMLALAERILSAEAELRKVSSLAEKRAMAFANQMNAELVVNKNELERSLDSERRMRDEQGRFIDTISHEYRTPLSIVKTNLDILHAKQQIDDKRFEVLASALKRLEDIFGDALQANQLGRPPPPKMGSIDLNAMLNEALDDVRDATPNCQFETHLDPARLHVWGDASLLLTALRNVLGNAAKYRSQGNVTVTLSQKGPSGVLLVENATDATFAANHESLFDRWSRGQTTSNKSGMGLGLYLVRRILHDHAGEATIFVNTPGRFAIELTLPLTQLD